MLPYYVTRNKLGPASALTPGFVLWGFRATLLGIFLGSSVTYVVVVGGFQLDRVASCIAAGSTVQAAVSEAALKRLMPNLESNDPRKVMRFSLLGVPSDRSPPARRKGPSGLHAQGSEL